MAGAPQQGKAREGDIGWHETQRGRVYLKRQLRVNKPRLRRKGRGPGKEVPVPVYEALQKETDTGDGERKSRQSSHRDTADTR